MKEVFIANKKKYLKENYPFKKIPELSDRRQCGHCGKIFTVGSYKVFSNVPNCDPDDELIFCPNAPVCDGTVIDWMSVREDKGYCNVCEQEVLMYAEEIYCNNDELFAILWCCENCENIIKTEKHIKQ